MGDRAAVLRDEDRLHTWLEISRDLHNKRYWDETTRMGGGKEHGIHERHQKLSLFGIKRKALRRHCCSLQLPALWEMQADRQREQIGTWKSWLDIRTKLFGFTMTMVKYAQREHSISSTEGVQDCDSVWLNWTIPEHPGLKRTTVTKGLDYLTSRGLSQTKLLYDSARAKGLHKKMKKPSESMILIYHLVSFFLFIFLLLQVSIVILNISLSLYYYIKHSFIQM